MNGDLILSLLAATVLAGTPLLYATLGEIVTERSGVINLGVEGMMILGAFFAFIVQLHTGNAWLAALAAGLDGVMVGTRFLMAAETDIGPHLRQAVMDAKETDTVLTQTSIRNALRSLKTQEALHIIDFEKTHHPTLEELYPLIRGTVTKAAYEKDDPQAAQIAMGQVLGRIHDVKPAAQIIQDMMDELYAMHRRVSNML